MTLLDLAGKNAWRKPLRTVLLMICIAVAFLIYGLTQSFLAGAQGSAAASDDILGVMSASGRTQPLPLALGGRLAAEPGVAALAYMTRLRGFVGVEKNVVAVSAVDPDLLMAVDGKGLGLTPALLSALEAGRDRVLVGRALADAQRWTSGQSITVTAFDVKRQEGSRDWRFSIAGIFEGETAATDTYFVLARYDYVNAARAKGRDTVDAFVLRPQEGVAPGTLAARIDALTANSSAPTRTQSEKQFLDAFLRQYADIGLMVNLVVGAAFVTLLMIVINTMIFAVRERRFEIGVLKTLGFSRAGIMALILAETLFVLVVGCVLGLALAWLGSEIAGPDLGPDLGLVFSPAIVAKALAIALALGLVTASLPAFHAMRIPIVTAFRAR
jgi:putative ABC transport system permease protein